MARIPKEYLGAFKAGHRKTSKPFIDEALARRLLKQIQIDNSEEAKQTLAWITRFNNEYYKGVIKINDHEALHNTDELRRNCYNLTHSRNRDVASVGDKIKHIPKNQNQPAKTEDNLIELLDLLKEQRLAIKN